MFRRFASHYTPSFVFYAEDAGTSGGTSNGDPKEDAANGDDAGKTSDTQTGGAITFKSEAELQAEIDRRLKERLAREDKKREKATEEATRKAEEAALKDQQKFQELADKQAKRLAELEPLPDQVEAHKAEIERYRDAFKAQLDAQRKDLPKPIIALLDKLDPIEQLTWIAENREAIVGTNGKTIIKASPNGATNNGELNEQQRRERAYKVRF